MYRILASGFLVELGYVYSRIIVVCLVMEYIHKSS